MEDTAWLLHAGEADYTTAPTLHARRPAKEITVVVSVLRVRIELPGTASLKEKRRVIASLKERVSNRFRVAAAEVAANDDVRRAVLAFAVVANTGVHTEAVLQKVMRFVEDAVPDRVSDARVFTEHYEAEDEFR